MGELHVGPKHPLSGSDPESYLDQPKGEGDCRYLAQYNQAYSGQVGHASLGQLPT